MNLYDVAYGLGVGLSAPVWMIKPSARRKVLDAFSQRMGRDLPGRDVAQPAVMIHAVSLGEMNATRALTQVLAEHRPELRCIISTTTQTGYDRARQLYGLDPRVTLIRYPLDFSGAIRRVLDTLRPNAVVLMELEIWPNFMLACHRRGIPVMLANGRITTSSFGRYKLIKPVVAKMLQRLARLCVQDQIYAERFTALGAPPKRVRVTGTMKFDSAQVSQDVPGAGDLAWSLGLSPGREYIWVCGSTGPGEEQTILRVYRRLLREKGRMRLVIVPRHPQRFDEVAELIASAKLRVVRRSVVPEATGPNYDPIPPVVLGDTMGELRKFYALADIVFVGRSLVDLGPRQHGSDMIEPAALARPVIVGPFTDNFAEAMNRFREARAVVEVNDEEQLYNAIAAGFTDRPAAAAMGRRAQQVVMKSQGATERHVQEILALLGLPT